LISAGRVLVAGAVADKPARLVSRAEPVVIVGDPRRFVSRGGDKLEAALDRFDVAVADRICLDAGASTGGFTQCLVEHGARSVLSVDVGRSQLHARLRADPRVRSLERTDIRALDLPALGLSPVDVVVADLSFISLSAVVGRLAGDLARPGADLVLLVKPQFEAGRREASRGRGVIRDAGVRAGALSKVAGALGRCEATIMGAMASPLLGPAGNAEFFLHAKAHGDAPTPEVVVARWIERAVAEAP
jgi:23S rRNA (cytidine1920-2'-O)/16S rRNA (cytidine1409-2'-O)-methyltransferase